MTKNDSKKIAWSKKNVPENAPKSPRSCQFGWHFWREPRPQFYAIVAAHPEDRHPDAFGHYSLYIVNPYRKPWLQKWEDTGKPMPFVSVWPVETTQHGREVHKIDFDTVAFNFGMLEGWTTRKPSIDDLVPLSIDHYNSIGCSFTCSLRDYQFHSTAKNSRNYLNLIRSCHKQQQQFVQQSTSIRKATLEHRSSICNACIILVPDSDHNTEIYFRVLVPCGNANVSLYLGKCYIDGSFFELKPVASDVHLFQLIDSNPIKVSGMEAKAEEPKRVEDYGKTEHSRAKNMYCQKKVWLEREIGVDGLFFRMRKHDREWIDKMKPEPKCCCCCQ